MPNFGHERGLHKVLNLEVSRLSLLYTELPVIRSIEPALHGLSHMLGIRKEKVGPRMLKQEPFAMRWFC